MGKKLLSVIIPVYNSELYLEECLNSVLSQTYENLEIIAINDGSTDTSLSILEKYSLKWNNITVVSQQNQGQSIARNKGIQIANGEYIHFLDSDDFLQTDAFEKLIYKIEKNNLDLILFGAEPFLDNINVTLNLEQYDFSNQYDSKKVYNKKEFLKLNLKSFYASSVLFVTKKELLIKEDLFFKPNIVHEDILFTLKLYLNVNRMMYDSGLFYKRRFRPNSTMTSSTLSHKMKSFDSLCIILDELYYLLHKYKNKEGIKLTKKVIKTTTAKIFFGYAEINKLYKIEKIKMIENFSSEQYYYWYFLSFLYKYRRYYKYKIQK